MSQSQNAPVSAFLRHHYRHFNAAALIDAADGYVASAQSAPTARAFGADSACRPSSMTATRATLPCILTS